MCVYMYIIFDSPVLRWELLSAILSCHSVNDPELCDPVSDARRGHTPFS